eukprot:m.835957 g.835957  ORF g.835957 m.835957 type:complete len:92 (-) comp59479_c0_seq24:121-396(-)
MGLERFFCPSPRSTLVLSLISCQDPDEEILELLRKAAKISSQEQLIILDMNFDRKYVAANQKISSMNVASFVRSFVEGRLTPVTFHAIHHD